jgi:hypothetical protein
MRSAIAIPGEEEDGPKDLIYGLVSPMFAQYVRLALPERCIIKTYFDAITSQT